MEVHVHDEEDEIEESEVAGDSDGVGYGLEKTDDAEGEGVAEARVGVDGGIVSPGTAAASSSLRSGTPRTWKASGGG